MPDGCLTVRPALTTAEWKAQAVTREGDIDERGTYAGTEGRRLGVSDMGEAEITYHGERARHAIAALALYEHPAGFTRAMLAVLDKAIAGIAEEWGEVPYGVGPWPDASDPVIARDLRDRIAALLPPEAT